MEGTPREIYEVVNHHKAFCFVKKCIADGKPLNERIVRDIHALLMENILVGGVYRSVEVRISGAKHKPPGPGEMYQQMKNFYADMSYFGGLCSGRGVAALCRNDSFTGRAAVG